MTGEILDVVLRTTVVFIVVLAGLRLLGKRHVAQLSIIDLVLILLISNAVQNAMVGPSTSLLAGIAAAVTLLVLSALFSWIRYRFRSAGKVLEGSPTLLIHNGRAVPKHLAEEEITEEELERAVREHGIASIREVRSAVMEPDGTISVIQEAPNIRHIESFKHRRTRYQTRKQT